MGCSEPWPGGANPLNMAERLMALLDAWEIERATLVGHDMGDQPALALAARHPERVSGLVVMNSLVIPDERTSWEIRLMRHFSFNRFVLTRLPWAVFRRAEWTFLPPGLRLPGDLRADLWVAFRRPEVRRFIVRLCAGYQRVLPRLPALYGQIACPTLVLWGERDGHFPPAQAHQLHTAIPGSCLEIVRDGWHWLAWYRAELVAEAVRALCGTAEG
jgi:pimeloyl-ACP methyl ester carboxylesterase